MLRDEIARYTELSGNDGEHTPIGIIGAYLDGYEKGLESRENKGEWIPVSERLPKNTDDVLVYDDSDIFIAWYSGIEGNWCSADNRLDEYTPIVAWQPLPEPYKAEREDKEW